MALIDVSELLLDPDFVNPIQIIRRTSSVNSMGENVIDSETVIDTFGSVQPAKYKDIQRLPEALRIEDVRSFYVKMEILQDGTSVYPDLIVWGGERFAVKTCAPWLNFGQGWNEGIAVREKPTV